MTKYNFKQSILACGAESKGVFSLAKGPNLFVSRDFGNLSDYNNLSRYEKNIRSNLTRLNIRPKTIACDMHPDYHSATFAQSLKLTSLKLIKVQHHHAHIASCMYDNNLRGKVIGVAFDGTGYGLDSNIWGGEFLISSFKDFTRISHLEYIPMPGADKAVEEPWRMAAIYLEKSFGDDFLSLDIPFTKKVKRKDWQLLKGMVDKKINSPLTSSIGRFFDAMGSILFCAPKANSEAELPMKLQKYAERAKGEDGSYKYNIIKRKDLFVIDPRDIVRGVVKDIKDRKSLLVIAARFHNTMAKMIQEVCIKIKRSSRINKVALSGGVFQNRLLLEKTKEKLKESGFEVYCHRLFPTNDAGISIGQVIIAEARSQICV